MYMYPERACVCAYLKVMWPKGLKHRTRCHCLQHSVANSSEETTVVGMGVE